jgi:hypothetical protein
LYLDVKVDIIGRFSKNGKMEQFVATTEPATQRIERRYAALKLPNLPLCSAHLRTGWLPNLNEIHSPAI